MDVSDDFKKGAGLWPPCRVACPVHADVRTYIKHISMGRYSEALDVIRQHLPYAAVCGRVCNHPCEQNCRRRDVDNPVAIRELKRYVAEHPVNKARPVRQVKQDKERIAIIGGGPSGMSAALELAREGYRPCVYEKEDLAGGIPAHAIPEYRLPRNVLQQDIDWILDHGIDLKTGISIGRDLSIDDLRDEGFEAVIIAAGMSRSRILPLPGSDSPRVFGALEFLKKLSLYKRIDIGQNILVIGGGSVACDTARSAVRLGCGQVRMICLENREEMPVQKGEIHEVTEEGIKTLYRRGPVEIVTDDSGNVTGLYHQKVTAVFDEKGLFSPKFDKDDIALTSCDTVIFAIGQTINPGFIKKSGLKLDKSKRLIFNPLTRQTNVEWIFACGEVVTPPGSVAEACASGQFTARAVISFCEGREIFIDTRLPDPIKRLDQKTISKITKRKRVKPKTREASNRIHDFATFKETLEDSKALMEASRCMACGSGADILTERCVLCLTCVRICPYQAPYISDVVNILTDRCMACGICISACPAKAIYMQNSEPEMLEKKIDAMYCSQDHSTKSKIIVYLCVQGISSGLSERKRFANCAEINLSNPAILEDSHILRTFEAGVDVVFIAILDDSNEYHKGACLRMRRRVATLKESLEEIGMHREQLQLVELDGLEETQVMQSLQQGIEKVEKVVDL